MKKKDIKVKQSKGKVEIIISFPDTKDAIEAIKRMFILEDKCTYCGGELEWWGSKEAICRKCGKKQ